MDGIVNLVLATSIWAAVGHSALPHIINQTESTSIRDTIAVNANCTKIKCQGDFPVSSTRRYAEAKHDARGTHPREIEGRILVAEIKLQESSFVRQEDGLCGASPTEGVYFSIHCASASP